MCGAGLAGLVQRMASLERIDVAREPRPADLGRVAHPSRPVLCKRRGTGSTFRRKLLRGL